MTDVTEDAKETVILVGGEPAPERGGAFLPKESLNALNLCFFLTTVCGAASEYFGSTTAVDTSATTEIGKLNRRYGVSAAGFGGWRMGAPCNSSAASWP